MQKNESRRGGENTIKNIGIGVGAALVLALIITAIAAALISGGKLPEKLMSHSVLAALFAGSLVGGFVAGKRNGGRAAIVGGGVGISIFALRLIISAFGEEGAIFSGYAFSVLLCSLAGGLGGGLLSVRRKKKRRK